MKGHTKMPEKIKIFNATTGNIEEVEKVYKTDAEWKKILTPEQFRITRLKGTEQPFTGTCPVPPKGKSGIYQCVCCGTDLFKYGTKFESSTGWPSFWEPVSELNIRLHPDDSFGMHRIEVLCARCDAHLGHVFNDGPPPTGKRYCINTIALKLKVMQDPKQEKLDKAAFAAGCFWGVEAVFRQVKGVVNANSGYMGGKTKNPAYEDVCTGKTGYAETVQVEYDPAVVSYEDLLNIFWKMHDPTTPNRQGPDVGNQYRSIIFYYTPQQKEAALLSLKKLRVSGKFKQSIVTEVVAAVDFYKAEEYHQRYYEKHGLQPTCHIPLK